jgi:hypothetical protein
MVAACWVEMVAVEASASGSEKLRVGHLYWHRWAVHLEWLEKLVRLREARPNIASRGLSRE